MVNKSASEQLLALFETMDVQGQQALLDYAGFLKERHPLKEVISTQSLDIERPAEESVIASIKRLRETYPMLDTAALLHETSNFMMQHVMQGREAKEVIDELEVYFRGQYEKFIQRHSDVSDT